MPNTSSDQNSLVNFTHLPSINFALQQNHGRKVRELSITNPTGEDWRQVKVEIGLLRHTSSQLYQQS